MQADAEPSNTEVDATATAGGSPGGRMLEDYRLGHTLGQGHFASVKLAQRQSTGKMVALKIIELDAAAPRQQEMIYRELTSMQQVQHENVLSLERTVTNVPFPRENGDPREVLLLELELAPGGELFDYILTGGAFPEPFARAYFKQLLLALGECHRVGVYHRDIKPENILLNENFQLKVGDFGLASLNPSSELLRTTCGTRSYQAPEILARQMYHGDKADVWSAGVVLFIMLAGNPPFKTAVRGDWWFNAISLNRYDQFWLAHQRPPAPKVYAEAQEFLNSIFTVTGEERKTVADLLNHRWIEFGSPDYPEAQTYQGVAEPATPLPTAEAIADFMSARKAVIDENNRIQREQTRARRRQQQQVAAEAGAGGAGNATFNPHGHNVYRSVSPGGTAEDSKCEAGEAKEAPVDTVDRGIEANADADGKQPPLLVEERAGAQAFAFYASESPQVLLELLGQATNTPATPATPLVLADDKAGAKSEGEAKGELKGANARDGEADVGVDWEEFSLDAVVADHVGIHFQVWSLDSRESSENNDGIYCVSALRVGGSPWEFTSAWKEVLGTLASMGCKGAEDALGSLASPVGFALLVEPADLKLAGAKDDDGAEEDISMDFDEKMVM
mmetsp:Transcript_34402/g.91073  ORF Transcript_34402/g.91073 Transcript_34402/m.91073 type:complete len:619 (+) Transcript_34402:295-2151(+)|eukprot:CAMPEP_0119469252 /NCGR_PEP_ID=MMETSP1344-20130328/2655_1 /TAXON_ID=236787 /ORGANISM="Florenciella parvula, Strain CCMP2471" /LENGTH=618 /DNA_ID=CAMNT_0007501799 /DNA_START=253 /DNA_END=2109 /DNA_ORIENTATION=+